MPFQLPDVTCSVWPATSVPVSCGAAVFTGGATFEPITPVWFEYCLAEPMLLVAVT